MKSTLTQKIEGTLLIPVLEKHPLRLHKPHALACPHVHDAKILMVTCCCHHVLAGWRQRPEAHSAVQVRSGERRLTATGMQLIAWRSAGA